MGVSALTNCCPNRLALPKGPTASVLRIFVLTGGEHDSSNELPSLVEMDIIFNGSLFLFLPPSSTISLNIKDTNLWVYR